MIMLKENSWHRNLQKYIYGKEVPLFKTFCPYFWLTILAIVLLVPVALLKLVLIPIVVRIGKALRYVSTEMDKVVYSRYSEAVLFNMFLEANNRLIPWSERCKMEVRLDTILMLREQRSGESPHHSS